MDSFKLSSYIKIMQKALNTSQVDTGQFLFGVFENSESLNLKFNSSDKVITGLIKYGKEVPLDLKEASKKPDMRLVVHDYFVSVIGPKISPFLLNDACEELLSLLRCDAYVSQKTVLEFEEIQDKQGQEIFLAECFLYALSKSNKMGEQPPKSDDFPLLDEVSNECPICHNKLTKKVKGVVKRHYGIVSIFPEDLDAKQQATFKKAYLPAQKLTSLDNQIALCSDHAESYLTEPEVDEYVQLSELKSATAKNYELKQSLAQIDLEDEISRVIVALTECSVNGSLEDLSLTALALKQKILPEFGLLKNAIQFDVLTYYHFIRELFSNVESYDLIASEVKKAFRKLEQANLTQPEIIEQLSDWLATHSKSSPSSLVACRIVISFFVQNCEVFREISQ